MHRGIDDRDGGAIARRMRRLLAVAVSGVFVLAACGKTEPGAPAQDAVQAPPPVTSQASPSPAAPAEGAPAGTRAAAAGDAAPRGPATAAAAPAPEMTLTSPDFAPGQPIPKTHAYTGEGDNRPPRLAWSNLPPGTCELALIVDDPDAPGTEPWVHDVLYKIPVDATPDLMVIRGGAVDSAARFLPGTNSWGETGWGGPLPPPGKVHHYVFTLYALDAELDLQPNLSKDALLAATAGHVLGTATLVGTYER